MAGVLRQKPSNWFSARISNFGSALTTVVKPALDIDIIGTYGGSVLGATRSRNFDCDPLRSPCVLPQVPYRDMRRRQRRGVKLSGQCNLNREIGSRIARGSCDCQPESGRVLGLTVWSTNVNRRKRREIRQAKPAERLEPKR